MPKDTFFNLGEEKKNRVLDAALEEFGNRSFHQTTVSDIVRRAEIPKGSFYQYFEDKKDLYSYLIKISQEKKLNFMSKALEEMAEESVFTQLRKLYRAGFRFAENNPKLLAIGQSLIKEDQALRQELLGKSASSGEDFIIKMLEQGVEEGEINPEVNLSVAASIITQYNLNLVDLFLEKPIQEEAEEFLSKIDDMLYIIKNGLLKEDVPE